MRVPGRQICYLFQSAPSLIVFLSWPVLASAQERTLFTYVDSDKAKDCFVQLSGKQWIEWVYQ